VDHRTWLREKLALLRGRDGVRSPLKYLSAALREDYAAPEGVVAAPGGRPVAAGAGGPAAAGDGAGCGAQSDAAGCGQAARP